jgi:hypothetical protein
MVDAIVTVNTLVTLVQDPAANGCTKSKKLRCRMRSAEPLVGTRNARHQRRHRVSLKSKR